MSRYIDADALKECYDWWRGEHTSHDMKEYADIFNEFINEQPAADVVEVVRCRDCYYSVISKDGNRGCKYLELEVEDDDFCSYGERKDE